jgi:hypothetical protein
LPILEISEKNQRIPVKRSEKSMMTGYSIAKITDQTIRIKGGGVCMKYKSKKI